MGHSTSYIYVQSDYYNHSTLAESLWSCENACTLHESLDLLLFKCGANVYVNIVYVTFPL